MGSICKPMLAAPETIPARDGISGTVPYFPASGIKTILRVRSRQSMSGWHSQCGITGGFMWLYDDFVGTGLAAQYAAAINAAVGGSGFTLSGPSSVFLNQNSTSTATITITDSNGFTGSVRLSLSALPKGVTASIQGTGNSQKIVFKGTSTAATGFTTVTVTGTSGSTTNTTTLSLAVSAGLGKTGTGTQIGLTSNFNLTGIYTDGTVYSATGGLDGIGDSYSSNLLSTSRVFNGVLFNVGPANELDAISCSGQVITLPSGKFATLTLLATGVQGNQTSQTITVKYTDGTTSKFVQSFSDWFTPEKYSRESEAVAMSYRNLSNGTKDQRTFNLYAYQLPLNAAKTVRSVTLPNDKDIAVLAATLSPAKAP